MPELSDFEKSMVPLAREAVISGLGYRDVADAFARTLITVAVQESKGNQVIAARRLGITQSFVSQVMTGKNLTGARRSKDLPNGRTT